MKKTAMWLLGWIAYPLVALLDQANSDPLYHEARLAVREWLRSPRGPERELARVKAHELTGLAARSR